MDVAEEERDVQLQRASADLISDFKTSLHPFLRSNKDGKQRVRRRVRALETDRLIALVGFSVQVNRYQLLILLFTA